VTRRILIIAAAVLAVLAAGATGAWFWAASRAEAALQAWAAHQRALGWKLEMSPATQGGFPLAVTLHVTGLRLETDPTMPPGPVMFAAERASFGANLVEPRRLLLHFDGAQQLRFGQGPVIPFVAQDVLLVLPIRPGMPLHEGDLTIDGLRVTLPGTDAVIAAENVHVHGEVHPAAGKGQAVLSFAVQSGPLVLPTGPALPSQLAAMGTRVDRLVLEGAVTGPVPPAPDPAATASAWRDGGGALTLQKLVLDWGKLSLEGSAQLGLDDRLQPTGQLTARLSGYAETLDALTAGGAVPPRTATAAKAVLSLMARPQQVGPAMVEVPLTLQNGTLLLGRIPLARMPELHWPSPPG
jgi:hypothetical protein